MKVLADTNIYISALLYPASKPAHALMSAAENHQLVLTDHNITELHRVVKEKFPNKLADADVLLAKLSFDLVFAPLAAQKLISDPNDAPILNAAIMNGVDVIISGDKHFLKLDIMYPKVLTVTEFLEAYETESPPSAGEREDMQKRP